MRDDYLRQCWYDIKQRCFNPKSKPYKNYGARGVTMCDAWRDSFAKFAADVGPRPSPLHSIDRYPDNNGNYEPGNVRWATVKEQSANRRTCHYVEYEGKRVPLKELAKRYGIAQQTFSYRILKLKLTVAQAISRPIDERQSLKARAANHARYGN